MNRLTMARERFEREWHSLRQSARREVGTEPRWRKSRILPVLALAVGVLVGAGVWRYQAKKHH